MASREQVIALASRCARAIADAYVSDLSGRSGWSKYYLSSPDEVGIWGTANGVEALSIAAKMGIGLGFSDDKAREMQISGITFLERQQIKFAEDNGGWSITQLKGPAFVDSTAIALMSIIMSDIEEHNQSIKDGVRWIINKALPTGGWSNLERDELERSTPKTCPTAYAMLALQASLKLPIWSATEKDRICRVLLDGGETIKRTITCNPLDPISYGWGRTLGGPPDPAYTSVALLGLRAINDLELIKQHGAGIIRLFETTYQDNVTTRFDQAPWPVVRDIWTPPLPLTERFMTFFTTAFLVRALSGLRLPGSFPFIHSSMDWLTQADRDGKFYDYQNVPHMFAAVDAMRACDAYLNAIDSGTLATLSRANDFKQSKSSSRKKKQLRKRVLISYKRDDCDDFAAWLARRLASSGIEPWLDQWNLVPGDSLPGKLEQAFAATDACLLLLSPNYVKGKWSTKEMRTAIAKSTKGEYRVIPVVVKPSRIPNLLVEFIRVSFISPDPTDIDRSIIELLRGINGSKRI